jgi:hypothetical protein
MFYTLEQGHKHNERKPRKFYDAVTKSYLDCQNEGGDGAVKW